MKKISIFLFLLISGAALLAQQTDISSFAHLKTLTMENGFRIHYPEAGTLVINKLCSKLPEGDPFYQGPDYPQGESDIKALQLKIRPEDKETITVLFTEGPSYDPSFIFARNSGEQITYIGGTELYITGNGFVYTSGHTNTAFNKRSKYSYDGENFTEVKQAFYYIGLNTTTTQAITIYADIEQTEAVASLPANSDVEVLLAVFKESNGGEEAFLIKTPFGLTGWYSFMTYRVGEDPPIKGIYYAGD